MSSISESLDSGFSTPPLRAMTPCPYAPRRKRERVESHMPYKAARTENLFKNPIIGRIDAKSKTILQEYGYTPSCYELNGRSFTVIGQVTVLGCGPTSLLMLVMDYFKHLEETTLKQKLTQGYKSLMDMVFNCSLTKAVDNVKKGRELGLVPHVLFYKFLKEHSSVYDPIEDVDTKIIEVNNGFDVLENILSITGKGHSVVLGITHKSIDGHWIIIDKIDGEDVYMRDPASGKAYKEDLDTIASYSQDQEAKIEAFYFTL